MTPGAGRGRVGRQVVRFPAGTWYNVFTGERFEGPSEQLVCAALDEFPLYARGGVPLPMQPYTRRPGTTVPETVLDLADYAGDDSVVEVPVRVLDAEAPRVLARQARADALAPETGGDARRGPPDLALRDALAAGDTEQAAALLALWGIGLVRKDESPYRFGGEPVMKLYAGPEVVSDGRLELEWRDGDGLRLAVATLGGGDYPVLVPIPATGDANALQLSAAFRLGKLDVHTVLPTCPV